MAKRQIRGNPRTHRIAHDRQALVPQEVKQPHGVVGHIVREIELRIIEFARAAMASVVDGDRPPTGLLQRLDPARIHPVDDAGGGKSVDQEDRLAVAISLVGKVDSGGAKHGHAAD